MTGSLKITCGHAQSVTVQSAAFDSLASQTHCTVQFWVEYASFEAGFNADIVRSGSYNPISVNGTSGSHVVYRMKNADFSKSIEKTLQTAPGSGHHILFSYAATGTSTLYIDGITVNTATDMGPTKAGNDIIVAGWDDGVSAMTMYLKDLAIWSGYSASLPDVIALRDGTSTPATLGTPAAHWWTLKGPAGAVTNNIQGLADQIGSVNLGTMTGAGVMTYDAHEITVKASALFMTPYVDTTGYLLFIPFYQNPVITAGGPVQPTAVTTDPVFTVAGSTVVPTRLPFDTLSAFVAYQFATPVTLGQAVTMAAALGWASTAAGVVGGTSAAGLGSAPLTCLNYAGTARDSAVVAPIFKIGYGMGSGGVRNAACQIMANWTRRLFSQNPGAPWAGTANILTWDANNLPASIDAGYVEAYIDAASAGNGMDNRAVPGLSGTITLIHGDATPGVNATTHILAIDLVTLETGWTVGSPTVVNAGDWDAGTSTWHHITKTYPVTWSTSGGHLTPNLLVKIQRIGGGAGAIVIPILANGQSELGVFEPDPANQAVTATVNYTAMFDPLAVSSGFLARFAGASAIRWVSNQLLGTSGAGGELIYPADLDIRKSTDFLATNSVTTTIDITRVDPISVPVQVICDYINGDATGTIPIYPTQISWYPFRGMLLATTATPHGLRTGDSPFVAEEPATARAPVLNSTYITLTANINNSQTVLPLSATANIGGDSESALFAGYFLQIGSATTDEQVEVVSIAGLNVTVNRAAKGTTALAKTSGTVIYPCAPVHYGGFGQAAFVVSSTQLLLFPFTKAIPHTAPAPPTLLYAQTYSHGSCPVFTHTLPQIPGTSSYELCSRATSLVAAANPTGECICWVNVPMFVTDAAITAVVNKMVPDFIATPGMRLFLQSDNEVFNVQFNGYQLATLLGLNAPNPQSGGTGFLDYYDYWASRQHQMNLVAKAAFTAAGLDPDRVIWVQNSTNQGSISQSSMRATIAFCQSYNLPIENITTSIYADMSNSLAATYVSWLPALTGVAGATASWDLATARKVMMSNYRASMRYGIVCAADVVDMAKSLSRYNNGISVDGSAPANTNPVRGRLCLYEQCTTQPLPIPFPGGSFPQCTAWTLSMQYDPEWYQTEWAYYQALQDMPYQYALLMGSKFPDPTDAIIEFGCYAYAIYQMFPADANFAYAYPMYRWQHQKPGYGDGSGGGVVNRLDFWDPTTPVNHDMTANRGILAPTINESVRGQVALDWIAASSSGGGRAALVMGM